MASSVEGSVDTLHLENEAVSAAGGTGQLGTAKGKAVPVDQWPEEAPPKPDSSAEYEDSSAEEGSGCCSPSADIPQPGDAEMGHPAPLEPAVSRMVGFSDPSAGPPVRLSKVSIAEMDCLICFNRYSPCRLPKLLACQHAFCAVCLKLILRNEEQNWVITCPLCRKVTLVFGGLICSLRVKEDILGRLEDPNPDAEVPRPSEAPGQSQADHQADPRGQEHTSDETNRVTTKRLVLLLLLVAMLIALVLPFMYTGLLKWALCFVVALGLLVSGVLCCNPSWNCSNLRLPPWRRKETQVESVA
ncbi:E3 ubiquitin-protein ligase RNF186 [Tiliqua scincoides]|uniref:E3 ubiquitin-protein ligase RNF186 n=1 Tax=Tiliqua scincoides TaxID=71010 RepID=UPI0034619F7E